MFLVGVGNIRVHLLARLVEAESQEAPDQAPPERITGPSCPGIKDLSRFLVLLLDAVLAQGFKLCEDIPQDLCPIRHDIIQSHPHGFTGLHGVIDSPGQNLFSRSLHLLDKQASFLGGKDHKVDRVAIHSLGREVIARNG